ncbi:recombinase family protein [Bacillus glycinifermentans]|uniref:recombinase family protein n=1 Tax=Bacillus glycinifermentans TaxID=1664069 RepID=UPI001584382E|nr:recombinase family protein [Bacillus glycinifermentans]NUJ19330.1 recombinase family protein [Bacillus glycinifermentans]
MRAAIYVRVSTEEQAREGYSISAQIQRLEDFARSQDWVIFDHYIDDGYSAKNLNRPDMNRMIKDIKDHRFDVVLVYRLDRMVRSVTNLHELLELFDENNVKFKSATEMFDTTSAMGRFFITLVAAMAQWERENLAERVYMGMRRMVEENKRPGASPPFGYDLVDGELVINEEEAKWVKKIFKGFLYKGRTAIAAMLNDAGVKTKKGNYWNDSVVTFIVNNPVYCGLIRWNHRKVSGRKTNEDILVEGNHPPIISRELFEKVKLVQSERAGRGYKGNSEYPFSGVLRCSRCGKVLIGAKRKRKKGYNRFYRCVGRTQFKICDLPMVSEEVLEDVFLNHLPAPKQPVILQQTSDDIQSLEKEMIKINKKIERIKELYLEGEIEKIDYNQKINTERNKAREIQFQLDNFEKPVNVNEVMDMLNEIKSLWPQLNYSEKKDAIHSIVKEIKVDVLYAAKHRAEKSVIEITEFKAK